MWTCLVLVESSKDLKPTESKVVCAIVVWSSLPQADEAEALAWDFGNREEVCKVISIQGVIIVAPIDDLPRRPIA